MRIGLGLGLTFIRGGGGELLPLPATTTAPTLTVPDPFIPGGSIDINQARVTDPVYTSVTWEVRVNGVEVGHDLEADGPWTIAGDAEDIVTVRVVAVTTNYRDVVVILSAGEIVTVPVVSGVSISPDPAIVSNVLTALYTATGYPTPAITFQWKLNGSNVIGATSSTYSYFQGDEPGPITVAVTATNSAGNDTTESANATLYAPPYGEGGGWEDVPDVTLGDSVLLENNDFLLLESATDKLLLEAV